MSNYKGNLYSDARKKGSTQSNGHTVTRQAPIQRVLLGNPAPIAFSIDTMVKGRYALIDDADLQPSHMGSSQNPKHFIPEAQPRNRATSASGALTPERIARNLRPDELLYGTTAYSGAPIINNRGEVIQGNGRAYALILYNQLDEKDHSGYLKAIQQGSGRFGIDADKATLRKFGITSPVLVRMLDVTDKEAIELGQYTQADTEAISTNTTKIKSKARLLTAPVLKRVLSELSRVDDGDDTSMAELIRGSKVLQVLIREDIIRPDDLENYTRSGEINQAGVDFVSSLLLNALFRGADVNTPDVFTLLPVASQNAIKKSTIYLLKSTGSKSLNKEVSNAILAYREFLASGQATLSGWKNQYDLGGKTPANRYSPLELALVDVLHKSTSQREVVRRFREYATLVNARAGDMFQAAAPGEVKRVAVKSVFGVNYRPDTAKIEPGRRATKALRSVRSRSAIRRKSTPQAQPTANTSTQINTEMTTADKKAFSERMAKSRAAAAKKTASTGKKKSASAKKTMPKAKSTMTRKKATGTKAKSTTKPKKSTATKAKSTRKKATGVKAKKTARKTTATKKATTAKTTVRVKNRTEQKGKNFIKQVDALAEKIHEKSATGEFVQVPVYKVSRSTAKRRAFAALSTARKTKNVTNVRLKV